MNTDNMTSSGETIDYGLCAFMDAVDPGTVLSSIDHGGRCAYGNQPAMAGWTLARFAGTLVPLLDAHQDTAGRRDRARRVVPGPYEAHWRVGMRVKLELVGRTRGPTPRR